MSIFENKNREKNPCFNLSECSEFGKIRRKIILHIAISIWEVLFVVLYKTSAHCPMPLLLLSLLLDALKRLCKARNNLSLCVCVCTRNAWETRKKVSKNNLCVCIWTWNNERAYWNASYCNLNLSLQLKAQSVHFSFIFMFNVQFKQRLVVLNQIETIEHWIQYAEDIHTHILSQRQNANMNRTNEWNIYGNSNVNSGTIQKTNRRKERSNHAMNGNNHDERGREREKKNKYFFQRLFIPLFHLDKCAMCM